MLNDARWIDLTHAFAPGIPHYVGFPDEQREVVIDLSRRVHRAPLFARGSVGNARRSAIAFSQRRSDARRVAGHLDMLLELVILDATSEVAADADYVAGGDPDRQARA